MKSQYEIKERLEHEEELINFWYKHEDNIMHNRRCGVIDALKFVLEDSKPKRTIFDLTEEELKELYCITVEHMRGADFILYDLINNGKDKSVSFSIKYPAIYGIVHICRIYPNLDIVIELRWLIGSKFVAILNQAKYIHCIEEMLSKPKP